MASAQERNTDNSLSGDIEEKNGNESDEDQTKSSENSSSSSSNSSVFPAWSKFTETKREQICQVLTSLSLSAARRPKLTVTVIPILSLLLVAVGFFTNFELILDPFEAFAPFGAAAVQHRKWIDNSDFLAVRNQFIMIIHADDQNIVGQEGIRRVITAVDVVRETPGFHDICTGESYYDLDTCEILSVGGFWGHNSTTMEEQVSSDDDVARAMMYPTFSDGFPVDLSQYVDTDSVNAVAEGSETLESAKAYFVYILLRQTDATISFEQNAIDSVLSLRDEWENEQGNIFRLEVNSVAVSPIEETNQAIYNDLPLVPIVMFFMSAFTCVVFFRMDRVKSRMSLGVGSVVTIGLSLMSGFGLMFIIGVPYTSMTTLLPFIVFGVGLDDTFIITTHFFRTDPKRDPIDRLSGTMSTIGLSIFVTTLTTSLAFMLGLISNIPAIFYLCLYAFPTIIIDFIYQITFFVAILILDERRVEANRMDLLVCCTVVSDTHDDDHDDVNEEQDLILKDSPTSTTKETMETEKSSVAVESDNAPEVSSCPTTEASMVSVQSSFAGPEEGNGVSATTTVPKSLPRKSDANEGGDLVVDSLEVTSTRGNNAEPTKHDDTENKYKPLPDRIMIWFSEILMRPWVKALVILAFAAFFGGCVYSTTLLHQAFDATDLMPEDSYLTTFVSVWTDHQARAFPVATYFRNVDQSDPDVQEQMRNYIDNLTQVPYMGKEPSFCWVKDWPEIANTLPEGMTFNEQLDFVLSIPQAMKVYGRSIVRDELSGNITASHCELHTSNHETSFITDSIQDQITFLHDQRQVGSEQPVNRGVRPADWSFFAYDDFFIMFEFYAVHISELITTTIASLAAVGFVTLLFLPHWSAVIFVLPIMVILYMDLLGAIQFSGLHMNVITFVALVVSIGLQVDFILHILLRYYESTAATREEKAKDSLQALGPSILVGGLSTFLGVVLLAFSTSAVLQTVYICFFWMILSGVCHGLILLPVLLSLFGPVVVVKGHASGNNNNTATSTSSTTNGIETNQ